MKRVIYILLLNCVMLTMQAQKIAVHVPPRVAVGETFQLQYTIQNVDVNGNIQLGNLPDGLEVAYGPSISQMTSYNNINGHTSSSSSITYTFMLVASKSGTYTIPAAHINGGGSRISSETVRVNVVGGGNAQSGNTGVKFHQDEPDNHPMRSAHSPITHRDLFIRVSANKTRVHEQEPVLLTYKVYTLVDLTQLNGKMPDLNGFHTQEVELPQQKVFHTENVDGRNYRCVTWSQYVMYPQMTGSLEIPSITFKGIVAQRNIDVDPFEAFFNGGSGYVEQEREIEAPGLNIEVLPLPEKPADFSGGVGRFNISAQIDKNEVKAGDPVNVRIVVGGVGNLKLITQPVMDLPKDFEKYDPKVTDKTRLTANGVEGNMVYDVLIVPRNQGNFTIPPISFTYYDTSANAYKTIKTQPFELNVLKGDNSTDEAVDFAEQKNKDIHPIKAGKANVRPADQFFFTSKAYWFWITIPLLVFVALLITFRKRAIDRADIGKMRGKKANKVAVKRLKKAQRLMESQQPDAFYDEVLRALWGYVGDKLNMPVEQLSRDNVSDQLASRGVEQSTINSFIEALDVCEYERYAPGDPAGNMNTTYNTAIKAITTIENTMKGRHHTANRAKMLLVMVMIGAACIPASAITKENADAEYQKGSYYQAIKDYEELLKQGVSADIYYNLGNAYYRTDNITRAILNYERALMLSPADEDIRFNLQLAQSKTIDNFADNSEMFFVTWYHSLVNSNSVDGWAYLAIVMVIMALLLILMYLFAESSLKRRIGFYGAILCVMLFIMANIFAFQQKRQLENRAGAIVIAPSVNVRNTPNDNDASSFVIHEGTKVLITDKSVKDWRAIRIADGREGWIPSANIEEI